MLIAWAFVCTIASADCEREAIIRTIVGEGVTPTGCLMDGQAGAAAQGIEAGDGARLVIRCRRKG